ncbi:MAG: hypothetical protein P1V97_01440, partial [Planctomycetota bacterium]|nr:hypothetical protein [Planctomycetota bacterium]
MNLRALPKILLVSLMFGGLTACNQSRGRKRKALFQLGSVPKIAAFISGEHCNVKLQSAFLIQNQKQWDILLYRH